MIPARARLLARALMCAALALTPGCQGAPPRHAADAVTGEPAPPPTADPRFEAAAAYSASRAGHALLVLEHGEVVYAAGQNGHALGAPHPLFGASEAFLGVLAAAAAADGLLDLDEPVHSTLPEFADGPWRREMRLRHLLQGTSGLEPGIVVFDREGPESAPERALSLEMVSQPGERFQVGPSHWVVFGEVLRRKLAPRGQTVLGYLDERLLEPLALEVTWATDAAGDPDLAAGASASARDWARLGELLAHRGSWNGATIVPAEVLEACSEGSEAYPGYGLGLWLNRAETGAAARKGRFGPRFAQSFYPGGLPDLLVAAGSDNQRLYAIPSLDLVVVRFGGFDRRFRDQTFLEHLVAGAADRQR